MSKKEMGARHLMYPMPAVLVGANVDGKANYLMAAWAGVMQATPPLVYASIRKERYTLQGIRENDTFSLNVPSAEMIIKADYCGIASGHDTDKSEVFTNFYGKLQTAPMIEECPVCMECSLINAIDFQGTHIICVGEVIECYAEESLMDGDLPDAKKVNPVIFTTEGKYWSLGEFIANSYSIGNQYKP